MDPFLFMKECLKEFNYPNIHGMDDEKIADIFSTMNRAFLVLWIFKQVDPDYHEIVENARKEELAELVYCNGFCDNCEKNKFLDGECEGSKQMEILYRMFKYLKNVSTLKPNLENNKNATLKDVEECIHFDTNLFPMYGPKQTLTPEGRAKKIQEYRKEIDDLRNLSTQEQIEDIAVEPNLKEQLVAFVKKLELIFPDFKRKVLEIMENGDPDDSSAHTFDEDFPNKIAACDENLKGVLELFKSMNVIASSEEIDSTRSLDPNDKNRAIREVAELCEEISVLRKENDSD